MNRFGRRQFLSRIGQGMFTATLGTALVSDLGMPSLLADDVSSSLNFGRLEPLVDLLQSTPLDKLIPTVLAQHRNGTNLQDLVAAAALANAQAFGGEDYIGFHTLMALRPALAMAEDMPTEAAPLPILKVLYRNSARMQETGANTQHALAPMAASSGAAGTAEAIRDAIHKRDKAAAEASLAAAVGNSARDAWNSLLTTTEEDNDVHRVVLVHRVWDMLDLVGEEHALTMLRQSLRYCVKSEEWSAKHSVTLRSKLPQWIDQYHLQDRPWGTKAVGADWVGQFTNTLFTSEPEQAAEAAAAALVDGVDPQRIFEAISLTANQLLLRDRGRTGNQVQPGKPEGSVHGDSIGVHASDSAHAWRGIASAGNALHRNTAVILAAHQVAKDRLERGGDFQNWKPRPWIEDLEPVKATGKDELLQELRSAVEGQDQSRACAVVARYGQMHDSEREVFQLLREYAVSQDGALHAEKYYHTTLSDFRFTNAGQRWQHAIALARVTASEYGKPAPGMEQAQDLLGQG